MKTISILNGDHQNLLPDIPKWVQKGITRRILNDKKIILISAACPDYAMDNGRFTYKGIGDDIPYVYSQHLRVVQTIQETLLDMDIDFEYHVTLADTEYDLPLVVGNMTGGDPMQFLGRCEESCRQIETRAISLNLPIKSCQRFTKAFPMWYVEYEKALALLEDEVANNSSSRNDLIITAQERSGLFLAMTGKPVDHKYCQKMILRQWAQYAAWGQCARAVFGEKIVMMNHSTPNLSRVNYKEMNENRERIPILQLNLSTMPGN